MLSVRHAGRSSPGPCLLLCPRPDAVSLLQHQTRQRGFDLSGTRLLDALANIREVGVLQTISRKCRKPALEITLSQMPKTGKALYDNLNLALFRTS